MLIIEYKKNSQRNIKYFLFGFNILRETKGNNMPEMSVAIGLIKIRLVIVPSKDMYIHITIIDDVYFLFTCILTIIYHY